MPNVHVAARQYIGSTYCAAAALFTELPVEIKSARTMLELTSVDKKIGQQVCEMVGKGRI